MNEDPFLITLYLLDLDDYFVLISTLVTIFTPETSKKDHIQLTHDLTNISRSHIPNRCFFSASSVFQELQSIRSHEVGADMRDKD